jgi:hypothetical protein
VQAALAAIDGEQASLPEKVEMLVEIAMGLQTRPKAVGTWTGWSSTTRP